MSTTATSYPSYTFRPGRNQQITWTLTDSSGNPISNAQVKATLYENRSRVNPNTSPGTIVDSTNFSNLTLTETPSGSGIYIGNIPAAFNVAQQAASGYVLQVTAIANGGTGQNLGDFESPAVVVPAANAIDLVLLDDVKAWLGLSPNNLDSDFLLQILISSFSQYVLNRTGISSFSSVQTYTEIYDGNNNLRLMLRNYPIQSLISVLIGSYTAALSPNTLSPGIFIDGDQKSIAFRWSPWNWPNYSTVSAVIYPYAFVKGLGNIQVTYTAGYTSVPYDLYEACMEAISINYKRKDTIDLASRMLSARDGSGTTRFRDWALTPAIERVLFYHSRYAHT